MYIFPNAYNLTKSRYFITYIIYIKNKTYIYIHKFQISKHFHKEIILCELDRRVVIL